MDLLTADTTDQSTCCSSAHRAHSISHEHGNKEEKILLLKSHCHLSSVPFAVDSKEIRTAASDTLREKEEICRCWFSQKPQDISLANFLQLLICCLPSTCQRHFATQGEIDAYVESDLFVISVVLSYSLPPSLSLFFRFNKNYCYLIGAEAERGFITASTGSPERR